MKRIVLILMMAVLSLSAATETELQRAYAKEFAFLKAQKEMLEKRLSQVKKEDAARIATAKKEIASLQNDVLVKTQTSDRLGEQLFRSQQNAENINDDTALLESVALQGQSSLAPYGIKLAINKEDYPATLQQLFASTLTLGRELSSVRVTEGSFYLKDGSEQKGKLVKVGNIATYGVAEGASGVLVPAGGDKLKLWDAPESAATAAALAQGQTPASLEIFVYENVSKEIEDKTEKSVMDVIESGGMIGWVIIVLGLFALLLVVLRAFFLSGAGSRTLPVAKETLNELKSKGVEATLEFLKMKKGAAARVMKATVRNLDRDREHVEDIVAEAIMHESERLDRYGSAIMVVAAVAPLLGLLGTVTGMIATFDIITEFGTGDPKLLSGGISIALVTTELGLIVAIPLLLLGNMLNGWAERIKDGMEQSALHLINEYNKLK
ncbi:MotA/TolQ/ExbB proton channel family protein [Sulfurimonas sp. HSL1-2]|uniref:MotA/TolQ/ExbB proton channel family protein n=1 Tax=Thiomicrolovo zhangzhouensis TaxID=3131933 RepID=UPI0031F87D63